MAEMQSHHVVTTTLHDKQHKVCSARKKQLKRSRERAAVTVRQRGMCV